MGNQTDDRSTIDIFCHIPKTGGMTFHHMLRRYFGASHLEGRPGKDWVYSASDLNRDLRFNPFLRSIGSHSMRPYIDFGHNASRLRWYTVLREPIARTISNYQHQTEKRSRETPFLEWLDKPYNQNWHVRMLAGEQDLVAAKQILSERIECFGLIEKYNEFLLLLRDKLAWEGFNLTYKRDRNPAKTNSVRKHIQDNMADYAAPLAAANNLDLELYDYAAEVLYPKQIESYGEKRMQEDLVSAFVDPSESSMEKFRVKSFHVVNKIAYPVVIKVTNAITPSGNEKE